MEHIGDITKVHGCVISPVDVAVGGSPCQDLSVAGGRAGLSGERSGLYMEQIRVIKEQRYADISRGRTGQLVRPRFMVWENVPGAFSSNKGEDFRIVLEEAARVADPDAVVPGPPKGRWTASGAILGDGWSIAWRVLDAQFWGVPQRRKRIALVADFGGHAAPEILFERKGVSGDSDQSGAPGKGAPQRAEGGAFGTVARSLTARNDGSPCADRGPNMVVQEVFCPHVAHGLRAKANLNFREDGDTLVCAAFIGGQGAKAKGIGWAEELSPTLKAAECGGNRAPCIFDARGNGAGEVSPTLTGDHQNRVTDYTAVVMATGQGGAEILAGCSPTLNCNHEQPIVAGLDCIHPVRIGKLVRRLTPLECERLQDYPDGWTDIGPWTDSKGKLHKESSDSARYKALGNSIALPQWRWVALRISALYGRPATLGSFFDGIGGFPLVWERLNGPGSCLWASEIEEFPMAVTRYHFGEGGPNGR